MKRNILTGFIALSSLALTLSACSDNDSDGTSANVPVTITLAMPINISGGSLHNTTVKLTNVQTGEVFTTQNITPAGGNYQVSLPNLPQGSYNAVVNGKITYDIPNSENTTTKVESNVKATRNGIVVKGGNATNAVTFNLLTTTGSEGFVISEICYTGTMTPQNKRYNSDQYIKITNNSDKVLYADSLCLVESAFTNTLKDDYTPNLLDRAMSVDAIYMIPGNGTSVPVQPGKSLLLALNAKNHKEANPASYDLSKADFEFYDVTTNTVADEDNAAVPNLDKWYCYTKSIFVLNVQGAKSYALAKIQGSKEAFLKNNFYQPYYLNNFVTPAKKMSEDAYFIPNEWIIDAVNLGMTKKYAWNIIPSTLDSGYTYCAEDNKDATRFGTAVVRKMENGKYIDTNNSANDFTPKAQPSMK